MHEAWRLNEMDADGWRSYQELCEKQMVGWLAEFENAVGTGSPTAGDQQQKIADSGLSSFLKALNKAAEAGKKRIGRASRSFVDKDVVMLLRERKQAICELREVPQGESHAQERLALIYVKERLRRAIRKKKAEAEVKMFRKIEGSDASCLLWNRWHARTKALAGSGSLPDAALDANGQLVTDQAAVLRVWRGFYERLGRADVIPDVGDRASASRFDDDFARQIVERLRERVLDPRGDLPELTKAIDWAELYAVLLASPDGKATGPDHVPYELLRHAGIGAAIALTALFNYFWRHQVWPEQLQRALLVALYKVKTSALTRIAIACSP